MLGNRGRLKPIRDTVCLQCGRHRRSVTTSRPSRRSYHGDSQSFFDPSSSTSRLSANRRTWANRLEESHPQPARPVPYPLHEPRLNDLRPGSSSFSSSAVVSSSRSTIPPALSRSYTHLLRRVLELHSWRDLDPTEPPQNYLFGNNKLPQSVLSRLDVHATVHACIRNGRPMVAAEFLDDLLARHLLDTPQAKRRVARTTLSYLFKACTYQLESQRLALERAALETEQKEGYHFDETTPPGEIREYIIEPRTHPFFAKIAPRNPTVITIDDLVVTLKSLVKLLRLLQDSRNPRPITVYKDLIAASVSLRRPDLAAGIYTGMVEEWIMEGRLAMGAQLENFHQGGGPPVEGREELELASDLLKAWWKGIRSWSLPGEVLSPHARIDLWHPRKASPSDRLRHFPLPNPTSPPSLVPAPDEELLNMILASLSLDPKKSAIVDFQLSMRACATLANTIHSRTLPYISKASLILVLGQVPYLPKVYPEEVDVKIIPKRDEWAYTAYTHVHLALQSLLWTPTTPAPRIQAIAAESQEAGMGIGSNVYGMAPLSLPACRALMKYGFRKLQSLSSAIPTFKYLSSTFSPRNLSGVLADMFHAAVTSRDENLMVRSKAMVFATPESRTVVVDADERDKAAPWFDQTGESSTPEMSTDAPRSGALSSTTEDGSVRAPSGRGALSGMLSSAIEPETSKSLAMSDTSVGEFIQMAIDAQTAIGSETAINDRDDSQLRFMALFRYYVWMNKPRMIEKLIRELIPHLDQPEAHQPHTLYPGLKPPQFLRPRTYKMALWALRMTCQTALAQRVFHHALLADAHWKQRYGLHGLARERHRTLIHSYGIMITLWKDTYQYSPTDSERSLTGRLLRPNHGPLEGFSVPANFDTLYRGSPSRQGLAMIFHIYSLAREAWIEAAWDPASQRIIPGGALGIAPDKVFLSSFLDALAPRWGVYQKLGKICDIRGRPPEPLRPEVLAEVKSFIDDMDMFKVPVPTILRIRAMDPEEAVLHPRYQSTVPTARTIRVMNIFKTIRQSQDEEGRVIIHAGRERERYNKREPAADLWSWQARGGGNMSKSAAFKAMARWRSQDQCDAQTAVSRRKDLAVDRSMKAGQHSLARFSAERYNERRLDEEEMRSFDRDKTSDELSGSDAEGGERSTGLATTGAPQASIKLQQGKGKVAPIKEAGGFAFTPSYT